MSVVETIPSPDAHFISVEDAATMTATYRSNRETILDSTYQNQDILPLSETFNRNAFDTLLARTDCEAIRVYYGMDENLKVHAVFVGVTDSNIDILPSSPPEENDFVAELGQRCPVTCPPASDLNS